GASWRYGFAALSLFAAALSVAAFLLLPPARRTDTGRRESLLSGIGRLIRLPPFHILFWSFLLCGFTTTGVIETHLLPYAAFCGFPPLPSATAYGVLSAVNLGGMILAGYLGDTVNRPA
ncbi:MFS transporter, partial [Rhizobiaceae sp. 2RAB30]